MFSFSYLITNIFENSTYHIWLFLPVSGVFGDLAVLVLLAGVAQLLPDAPLEEPFAALATDGAIVSSWNQTEKLLVSLSNVRGR